MNIGSNRWVATFILGSLILSGFSISVHSISLEARRESLTISSKAVVSYAPSYNISPEPNYTETKYVIWKNSTHTIAKNHATGNIDYAHENTSNVIQWALDNVSNAGGGLISVKKDRYYLTPQSDILWGRVALVPRSNVYLRLEEGTIMNQTHVNDPNPSADDLISFVVFRPSKENEQLKRFVIDGGIWDANHGNWTNQIAVGNVPAGKYWNLHGLYFAGNSTHPSEDIVVKNLEVRNVACKGINFYLNKRSRAERVKLDRAGKNSFVIEGSQMQPDWDSDWCTLAYSEIIHSGVTMAAVWNAKNALFIGNKLHDAEQPSFFLFLADGGSKNVVLKENDFYGTGKAQQSYASKGNILFWSNSFQVPVWVTGKETYLVDNRFFDNVYISGILESPEYTNSLVLNNTFNNSSLVVGTPDKLSNVTVGHNVWKQESGECVRLQNGAKNVVIEENLMQGDFGIRAFGTATFDNIHILNNDMQGSLTPISSEVIKGAEKSTFIGNDGYNPQGYLSNPWNNTNFHLLDETGMSSPLNDTTYTSWQSPKRIHVSGGSIVAIVINGQTTSSTETDFTIYLHPGDTIRLQWKSAPSVEVFGE